MPSKSTTDTTNPKVKQVTIKLRAEDNTPKGRTLLSLRNNILSPDSQIWQILIAWYSPFNLNPDDPKLRSVAAQAVGFLEGRAKAIREYAQLNPSNIVSLPVTTSQNGENNKFQENVMNQAKESQSQGFTNLSSLNKDLGL